MRQNKVARLMQKDMGDIFQREGRTLFPGAMITVTNLNMIHIKHPVIILRVHVNVLFLHGKLSLVYLHVYTIVFQIMFLPQNSLELEHLKNIAYASGLITKHCII